MSESEPQNEPNPDAPQAARPNAAFASTQWSIVVAAGNQSSSVSRDALETLCRSYWYPLYVFVRRRGYAAERAEDLTQAFFASLIEHGSFAKVAPSGGRFRSFLLKSISNFLNNEHKYRRREKRGGRVVLQSIDFVRGDRQYSFEPADELTPDLLFERQWACASLELARSRLAQQYQGQDELFAALEPFISGEASETKYADIARRLGLSEDAFKVAVHRVRKRFKQSLRAVILETVGSTNEVDGEICYLMSVFQK